MFRQVHLTRASHLKEPTPGSLLKERSGSQRTRESGLEELANPIQDLRRPWDMKAHSHFILSGRESKNALLSLRQRQKRPTGKENRKPRGRPKLT